MHIHIVHKQIYICGFKISLGEQFFKTLSRLLRRVIIKKNKLRNIAYIMPGTNHPRAFTLAVSVLGILFLQILSGLTPSSPSLFYTNTIFPSLHKYHLCGPPPPPTYLNCNVLCFLFLLAASFFLTLAYLAHSIFYLFFLFITWKVSSALFTGLPSVPRISSGVGWPLNADSLHEYQDGAGM